MRPTSSGEFRVLDDPERSDSLLLVDRSDLEPVRVTRTGYDGTVRETVDGLRPGYRVEATLEWIDGEARAVDLDVRATTLYSYSDHVTDLFEDARKTWAEATREGLGVNGRTTYSTDGEPNGAVYTFAEQPGVRDVWWELRDGSLPLEPLLDRVGEVEPEPFEVFVLRPAEGGFVVVYIVTAKGSMLADTVRETYGCPRPAEPLAHR